MGFERGQAGWRVYEEITEEGERRKRCKMGMKVMDCQRDDWRERGVNG